MDKEVIRVSFLTQDSGLGDAIARALGEDFSTRTIAEWNLDQAALVCDACDVILLDLRTANTQGDDEAMLRLMDAIGKSPTHPPMVCSTKKTTVVCFSVRSITAPKTASPIRQT